MDRRFDLEAWRHFVLVAEQGGLNMAANVYNIEPSTLSRSIKSLETSLERQLFVHGKRPLCLTVFGQEALREAQKLLSQHTIMLETLQSSKDKMEGLIRLAIPGGIGPSVVTPKILEFQQMYPNIEFDVIQRHKTMMPNSDLSFEGGQPHLTLGYGTGGSLEGLVCRYVGKMDFIPCCSPSYISHCGAPEDPDELIEHKGLIFKGSTRKPTEFLIKNGIRKHIHWNKICTFETVVDMKNACLLGGGIAADLPLIHCIDELETGSLKVVLAGWRRPSLGCYLFSPQQFWEYERVRVFGEWLAQQQTKEIAELHRRFDQLAQDSLGVSSVKIQNHFF